MDRPDQAKLDIVLWGATGYTGRLVAEYLSQVMAGGTQLRWALAARSHAKLLALRAGLAAIYEQAADLPLIVADSHDEASLRAMAQKTRVICTTVGPYGLHGETLVRVAAEEGIATCDLTGETPWMQAMIDRYHDLAAEKGARIVHTCGFDSIPSDLGCAMLQGFALVRHGAPCRDMRFFLGRVKGGLSGGTVASMNAVIDQARDPAVRRALVDPYALNPEGERRGPDGRDQLGIGFDEDLQQWTGPFLMGPVNTRVVRRGHALLGWPWGHDFSYSEATSHGAGRRGWMRAAKMTAGVAALQAGMIFPPSRKLLMSKLLPQPGEGPSEAEREAGSFTITLVGRGVDADGQAFRVRGEVAGDRDPGYGETAKMLGESALCLALDEAKLPRRAGMLTPSTAMGEVLTERLRRAGMRFEVEDWPPL